MSGDPRDVLREQMQYWEGIERTAREQLRIAEAVLPGLRQSLRQIESLDSAPNVGGGEVPTSPLGSPAIPAPAVPTATVETGQPIEPENDGDEEVRPVGAKELRTAEEVGAAIREVLPELGRQFNQNIISQRFVQRGWFVKRTTLRGNLNTMAAAGDTIRTSIPGRGRRATIFEKVEPQT